MKRRAAVHAMYALCVLSIIAIPLQAQTATNVVISEFATRGQQNTQGEFVELYNPTNADIDMSGWKLQYRSAAGSSYSNMGTVPANTVIHPHSYYLCAGTAWTGVPAADMLWTSSGIADDGNLRLVDASNAEVDRVGYGAGNDPKGSPAPNHGTAANSNSVERKASATSTAATLAAGGAEEFAGNGYNSGNNATDFVEQTNGRNPQNASSPPEPRTNDGSGSAYSKLLRAKSGQTVTIPIVFKPEAGRTITDMKIEVPGPFNWSQSGTDVFITSGMTGTIAVTLDSIFLTNLTMTGDSAVITLFNQTAATATGQYQYTVSTRGAGGSYRPIQFQPSIVVTGGAIPITTARENDVQGVPKRLNQYVTVSGIVTVSNEFGLPSFLQDATGGLAVYDFNFASAVATGDEVTITGKVTQFNGLTELADVTIDAKTGTGKTVTPQEVTISQLEADGANGIETYEGNLIRINGVTVNTGTWSVSGAGTNYRISDGKKELDIRVDKDVNYANKPAPTGNFDIIGVLSQYAQSSPYIGGYQLMPRSTADIKATGPSFTTVPVESEISPNGMKFTWQTNIGAAAYIRHWQDESQTILGTTAGSSSGTDQLVQISGLQPGTIYRVQPFSVANNDTSYVAPFYVCTSSATSTGTINVFFNKSVDNTVYPIWPAQGNVALKGKILDRIDAATYSIDAALYNLSGATGDDIAASLLSAKSRGVKVRVIIEADNGTSSAIQNLRNNGVPLILDNFDPVNAGSGLMHNKFLVIDARDRASDRDDWVATGSWNATDPGLNDDAQNYVEIQDQALAVTYTKEFEEMWGSNTETANSTVARFGQRKSNNTPHRFVIGGRRVECYFSPTDRVTDFLVNTVKKARTSVYFCILTFTRDDLATAMINKVKEGRAVRGVMDNRTDQGSEYDNLLANGVDVLLKKNLSGLLHHKYMVADGDDKDVLVNPVVITGSHNWSTAAEILNNENTIAIYDAGIARLYLQEWFKRYVDAGGTAGLVLGVDRISSAAAFALRQNYPDPVVAAGAAGGASAGTTTIEVALDARRQVALRVYDMLGRAVATIHEGVMDPGSYAFHLDAASLPAGTYRYVLTDGNSSQSRMMVVTR
jgi:phosphatidylserine/phosphatidylglycerophosphate/cardiolipin synthase-like enzyme